MKNVLAIATGICDGLASARRRSALGLNARAALITRGLAEMTRLGVALGARAETFMGLSGLGDLVLTATGDLSRNRQVGLLLAAGRRLPQILRRARPCRRRRAQRRHGAGARAQRWASRCRSPRPWSRCSTGASRRAQALQELMAREARAES